MKKVLLSVVLFIIFGPLWSQDESAPEKKVENRNFRIPLIGEIAPSFTATSTTGTITFPQDFGRKWKVLVSHPQDFTPVCSSEIIELANLQSEFDELNARLVVVSTDPLETHTQWKKALEEINYKGKLPEKIKFPLVDDENLNVAKLYGMIHSPTNTTRDVRGVFIIDPENYIRTILFYPMEVGRSTEEIIRTLTALQVTSQNKVSTPADWKAGQDVIVPYLPENYTDPKEIPGDYYQLAWFMWFRKMNTGSSK